jgi:hypothetical protein
MKLINLTPHVITVLLPDGKLHIEPSGKTIRLSEEVEKIDEIKQIPITKKQYGYADYVPEEKEGTYYIVSGLVASAMKRSDFLVPNTVRDENGKIIGCDSFSVITE